ncbi:methionine synthase [Pseudonocardia acaciae]|uniref:methionine synthase n=1 Tax=Pseudonocardia acaciae TaxID=551276 RepID=UPI00048CF768|nr:methionine synthase [Pseudonocardia acaciae]
MSTSHWPPGTATGIGSLPGTDPREAARTVAGELPELPHLPELPARGVGADLIGRTAALLVDLATEVVPSGYRVTARPGRDQRRGVDLLRADLDALEEALDATRPAWVKLQAAGPWTLAAGVELRGGHRVLTDHGARREFAASLTEGLAAHADEVAKRTGARVVVQLDEPSLPAVLAGSLPTPSGFGTVAPVPDPDAESLLHAVIEPLPEPVIVHCCAPKAPIGLLRAAGAGALALDAALVGSHTAALDAIGEAWDAGVPLLLGLVPALPPTPEPTLRDLVRPAFDLADQVGFARARLADLVVPTPACGLAGATPAWSRRAMALARDLGRAIVDPTESLS